MSSLSPTVMDGCVLSNQSCASSRLLVCLIPSSLYLSLCCLSVCLSGGLVLGRWLLVVVWLVRPSVQKMGRNKLDRSDERLGGRGEDRMVTRRGWHTDVLTYLSLFS